MRRPIVLLAALAAAISCSRSDRPAGQNTPHKRVAVTLLTREHEFYRELEAGLRDAAERQGLDVTVTSGDFDLARQQSQIENFIVQGADAIIVCPVDSKGIAPAIEKANAAHIPVFTADIAARGGAVVSHVASDNIEGGRMAARFIAQAIGDSGEVGIISQPEVQSTIDREQGFREEMAKHPKIRIVASLNGYGVRDRALKAAEDMLQAHPNLRAVFAINDDSALGTLSAAQSRNRAGLVIVGYDATPEAVRAIAGGTALKADVAQQPRDIGRRVIEAVAAHLAGQHVDSLIAVPIRIVDADSAKALLAAPSAPAAAPK